MSRRAWRDRPLVWINGGVFIALWLFGAGHAWRDHPASQAFAALLLPPYGAWMALEYELEHRGRIDWESRAEKCREDELGFLRSGLNREQYAVWCECTWRMVAESPLAAGGRASLAKRRSSKEFESLTVYARGTCFSSAKYLGKTIPEAPVYN